MSQENGARPGAGPSNGDGTSVEGVLELDQQNAGFLRSLKRHLAVHADDPYVSADAVRKFALRGAELVAGPVAPVDGKGNRRYKLIRIDAINSIPVKDWFPPKPLNETTAIDPTEPPGMLDQVWVSNTCALGRRLACQACACQGC